MQNGAARFVWYELMTTDPEAAAGFYRSVLGWEPKPFEASPFPYLVLEAAGQGVAGIMALPEEARAGGMPPGWLGYVGVPDVDAATEKLRGAGGAVHKPPQDIPSVGRFSVVSDPQGAVFMLFTPASAEGPKPNGGMPAVAWHELHSTDWQKGFDFYAGQFGWAKHEAMEMGPMGTYQIFGEPGGEAMGGMMTNPMAPRPHWLFYACVDDIDAAQKRLTDQGGTVLHGPQEVPGEAWIIQARDPQGAMFAIVGPRG